MKTAVIYKSKYGATKTYAQWISKELNADLLSAEQVKAGDLSNYDTIIYGGGVYAGSVNGIALLTKNYEIIKNKKLYLFTVGLSDTDAPETQKAICNILEQKLTPVLLEKLHVYHLRGAMQFSKLSLTHRLMMRMFIKMLSKKPLNERTPDEKGMLDTITKDTDFTDRSIITPLVEDVKSNI